jgi:cbb3-type cytochrome oxidase subunit 1
LAGIVATRSETEIYVVGSLQAVMSANRYVHFSDWVIGHFDQAMIGFTSFGLV